MRVPVSQVCPKYLTRRNVSPCIITTLSRYGVTGNLLPCLSSGQSEDGKYNANCTDTQGEDGRSDFETGRAVITAVACGSVGRSGGGPGAGGDRRDTRSRGVTEGGKSSVDGGRGVSDAIGRSRDLGLVWHGGNRTQRLGRLSVGLNLTAGICVDARVVLIVTLAGLESTVFGIAGGVVETSDTVVDMFAEMSRVGASRVAYLEAEGASTEEARTEG